MAHFPYTKPFTTEGDNMDDLVDGMRKLNYTAKTMFTKVGRVSRGRYSSDLGSALHEADRAGQAAEVFLDQVDLCPVLEQGHALSSPGRL